MCIRDSNKRHADLIFTKIDKEFPNEFGVIHSNKSQNFRLRTMKSFSDNELRGIITTDAVSYTHLDVYKRQG